MQSSNGSVNQMTGDWRVPRNGAVLSKREVFGWAKPGDTGEFRRISKKLLSVDHAYQRTKLSIGRINRIAKHFNWPAFGVLLVMQRTDGSYYVYDGQHRLGAAMKHDEVNDLPCLVFVAKSLSEEAEAFSKCNGDRGTVGAIDRYRADIVAEVPDALLLKAALEEWDYEISEKRGIGKVSCVQILRSELRSDAARFRRALQTCYLFANGSGFDGHFFGALCAVDRHCTKTIGEDLSTPRIATKLQETTFDELDRWRRRWQAKVDCGRNHGYRLSVMHYLNKGWRNRIPMEGEE